MASTVLFVSIGDPEAQAPSSSKEKKTVMITVAAPSSRKKATKKQVKTKEGTKKEVKTKEGTKKEVKTKDGTKKEVTTKEVTKKKDETKEGIKKRPSAAEVLSLAMASNKETLSGDPEAEAPSSSKEKKTVMKRPVAAPSSRKKATKEQVKTNEGTKKEVKTKEGTKKEVKTKDGTKKEVTTKEVTKKKDEIMEGIISWQMGKKRAAARQRMCGSPLSPLRSSSEDPPPLDAADVD